MKRARGFSLLEVLTALALLGVMLAGVLSSIRTATRMVGTGSHAMEAADEARSVQRFLRRDLLQARGIPWKLDDKGLPVVFEGDARRMRFVAPLPGYLDRAGPQLQTLALVDDGGGRLRLDVASTGVGPRGATPGVGFEAEPLAAALSHGRFRYYGRRSDHGPNEWMDEWHVPLRLPELVEVQLERERGDTWLLIEAPIRQGPNATNVRGLARTLPDAGRF